MRCAICHIELTTADADEAVKTDAGPVHPECFDGPVPPPAKADDILADLQEQDLIDADEEEAARREHGDPPLPYDAIRELPDGSRVIIEHKVGDDLPKGDPADQLGRYERAFGSSPPSQTDPRLDCPECEAEPSYNGGRGLKCRGRSML